MSTRNASPPSPAAHAAGGPQSGWRTLALAAVVVGVLLLTAAACVLSYSGIHALARQAGASVQLARVYPVIFDAMAVVAGSSVLALRDAGLPSRCYAWLCFLLLLAALAAGSAAHAAAVTIPHRPAEYTAAIVPWVLVLLGFGLLLALLRQARLRRQARTGPGGRGRATGPVISAPAAPAADVALPEGGWVTAAAPTGAEPATTDFPAAEPTSSEPATVQLPAAEPTSSEPATSELPIREPGAGWSRDGTAAPTEPIGTAPRTPQAELQLRATFPARPTGPTEPEQPDLSGTEQPETANPDDADTPGAEEAGPPTFERPRSSPLPPVD